MSGLRAALVALGAAVLTAACAAGQQAQTANEKPSLDGTEGGVGNIQLVGAAFHPPAGTSYPAGSAVPLSVYIVNNGRTPDKLVNVSSSAFSGWSVTSGSSSAAGSAGSSRPLPIGAGSAVGFGLENLTGSRPTSPRTLVLDGLAKNDAPLYPGTSVKVTFTFAGAGQATLVVPVQLTPTPNSASLPAQSGSAAP